MKLKRPMLVTLIGDLNLLGAFLIIVSFFPMQKFIEQFDLLIIPASGLLDATIRISSVLYYLKEPYSEFKYNKDCGQWKEILRNSRDIWWIEDIIENINSKTINIVIDPYDELRAGIYEVNLVNYDVKKYYYSLINRKIINV